MTTYALLNNIQLSLDKKRLVGGIFCDLQKAFDCVNHDIFLEKMKYYVITGTAYKLMKSYLGNRYQRTVIKEKNSNKLSSSWKITKQEFHKDQYWDLYFFSSILMIFQHP